MIKSHKKQVQPRGGGRGDQESQKTGSAERRWER